MAQRVAVINVVGLTRAMLGAHTPRMTGLASEGQVVDLDPPFPAVTCPVQSSMLTGLDPCGHGIVANGWHDRRQCSTAFWQQSNELVAGEKLWEAARRSDPSITTASMFWWFNMHGTVDVAVTPRPQYLASGRKIPDIWTNPPGLRESLQHELGPFPLFRFWGPASDITSSRWIAQASMRVERECQPTILLIYLPHLDYPLQQVGPDHSSIAGELRAIDDVVGDLADHCREAGMKVVLVSEYGIDAVSDAVPINRLLREAGLLEVRQERGRELLDVQASRAFAAPDHQVAHVYVASAEDGPLAAEVLRSAPGIDLVLDAGAIADAGIAHERCGDLVAVSDADRWCCHDWWSSDDAAPAYQATVDIHRKPGYDPRELFLARGWRGSRLRMATLLARRRLGMRTLLDVITLDTSVVAGSHGRTPAMGASSPVLVLPTGAPEFPARLPSTSIKKLVLGLVSRD